MKRYDLLTPEGTRDLLFDECAALREAEERLRSIFLSRGFSEAVTPGLEFYDVFNTRSRRFSQEEMYKLTDAKGRLLVLRPDSTMPIARVVGTRLRDRKFPQKLFYCQTIYRVNPKDSGRDDEFSQSGIEIIGGDVRHSDFEALAIATRVMNTLADKDFRFEIGDSSFFSILSAKLGLSEDELDEIRGLVQSKNYPGLSAALSGYKDNPYAAALRELPKLFGGSGIFEQAEKIMPDDNTRFVLARLKELHKNLCTLCHSGNITVDLGLISKNEDYYTGVVFRGYTHGYGMPILSGGRYDKLVADYGVDVPAIGFAVNLNAAAALILRGADEPLAKRPDVLVYAKEADMTAGAVHCSRLIDEGLKVDFADFKTLAEARRYAKDRGITRLDIVSADSVKTEQTEV